MAKEILWEALFKVQFEVDYKIEVNLILYKAYFQAFVCSRTEKVYCMAKWMSNWDCLCKLWREWRFWDYAIMLIPNAPLILHWHWDWEGETEGIREMPCYSSAFNSFQWALEGMKGGAWGGARGKKKKAKKGRRLGNIN